MQRCSLHWKASQSPQKIWGCWTAIFKANLKSGRHSLAGYKSELETGTLDGSGMCHTSRAGEDIAVDVHAYKCS